jgi:predicted DsbA family dithiol-disulfide isomerase
MICLSDSDLTKITWSSSKEEVEAWLEYSKQDLGLEFDVQQLVSPGKSFVALSKDDFKELAGPAAGINLFNALQKGFFFRTCILYLSCAFVFDQFCFHL